VSVKALIDAPTSPKVAEHHDRRGHDRGGVNHALSRVLGRGAVDRLKDGDCISDVRGRCKAKPADASV